MEQHQKQRVPAVEGLFTWPSAEPCLIGSRCRSCNTCYFPAISTCMNPECDDKENVEQVSLSRKGKLWSYTIQVYNPPPPFPQVPKEQFTPFAVGIVELPEGVRVIGMLTTTENLEIGMELELVAGKLYEDENNEYLTWKFKPTSQGG